MDKNLDELVKEIREAQSDIIQAESIAYNEKWKDTIIPVPAPFVNWDMVVTILAKEPKNIEILGQWDTKLVSSDALEKVLGFFASYQEAFVEYVNFSRFSYIKKNISAFASVGYLDLILDEKGDEKYTVNGETVESEDAVKFLDKYINAYENFRR